MDDAGSGGHGAEVAERLLGPAEKGIALAIALVFEQDVDAEGILGRKGVDLNGVVDDEVAGDERVGEFGFGAEFLKGVAHGGEVDDAGDSGEVLKDDSRG